MEHVQEAFDNMKDKPFSDMTNRELWDLQWLVMQAIQENIASEPLSGL